MATTTYNGVESTEETDDVETCPICFEDISTNKNFCITDCGHKFCMGCIPRHLQINQKCPMCRAQVAPDIKYSDAAMVRAERYRQERREGYDAGLLKGQREVWMLKNKLKDEKDKTRLWYNRAFDSGFAYKKNVY